MAIDAAKAAAWAAGNDHTGLKALGSGFLFWWHQVLPKAFQTHLSVGRILCLVVKILAVVFIAASPIWIDYAEKGEISLDKTIMYTSLLVAALFIIWAYDNFRDSRATNRIKRNHEMRVALEHNRATGKFGEVITLKSGPVNIQKRDQLIDFILTCIDHKARTFVDRYEEGYFQVTLMVFLDSQGMQFQIKSRATHSRQTGIAVNARESAAYYVGRANRGWKAIHDLKNDGIFPYEGLSDKQSPPPYRSILMIPILYEALTAQGNRQLCLGVLSLDTAKPYEFWGAVGSDLTTQIQPYSRMLGLLLDNTNGMPV
jgi:hypothetical protein